MNAWSELKWVRVEPENPAVILFRLSGSIKGSQECYSFLEDVRKDAKGDYKHVVLNLDGIDRINSAGVGILCACFTSITGTEGKMYLVNVSDRNKMLLEVVGLWDQLNHYASEDDVVFS